MSRPLLLCLLAVTAVAGIIPPASARDYDDRRQDRREAIVAGVVRNKIVTERAEDRYKECMRESRYDEDCARQRWEDEQDARKKGRRAAIIVGAH